MAKPANKPPAKAAKRKDRRGCPKGSGTVTGAGGRGRIGNPKFVPTHDQRVKVEVLAANCFTQEMIAIELEVSIDTLQRHFREELAAGEARLRSRIGATIAEQALAGCRKSQRLFMDRRGGEDWKPKSAVEHSGPNGSPITYSNEPPRRDLSHLSEDEKLELERLTAKLEAPVERAADE
jgi:hypothetical protein